MNEKKIAISVTQMAKDLGLSRARFYQLSKSGAFPKPRYCDETKRPFYDLELQEICHEVRRRNCGINGKVIMFYSARRPVTPKSKPKASKKHVELIESLSDLGLSASAADVDAAIKTCFPSGIKGVEQGEIIRAIFLFLKRQE